MAGLAECGRGWRGTRGKSVRTFKSCKGEWFYPDALALQGFLRKGYWDGSCILAISLSSVTRRMSGTEMVAGRPQLGDYCNSKKRNDEAQTISFRSHWEGTDLRNMQRLVRLTG